MPKTPQEAAASKSLDKLVTLNAGDRMGVAVSGGSDSMALLHLLQAICQHRGATLYAFTVDHCLRDASAQEAEDVANHCYEHGIYHETLQWAGEHAWSGKGNLQEEARKARYRLLTEASARHDIKAIAVGHTIDDQAETVLMRMARKSGTRGLSGISPSFSKDGQLFVRPILDLKRNDLRDYLRSRNVSWIDDPSNENDDFERVRMRKLLATGTLGEIGITAEALAAIASNMRETEASLSQSVENARDGFSENQFGAAIYDLQDFSCLGTEIKRRLLLSEIKAIARPTSPPRQKSVQVLIDAIERGRKTNACGCLVIPHKVYGRSQFVICREPQSVQQTYAENDLWDGRWAIPQEYRGDIQAMGDMPEARLLAKEHKLPHEVFSTLPAMLDGEDLIWSPAGPVFKPSISPKR